MEAVASSRSPAANRTIIATAALVTMALAALDSTAVATALPTIVGSLGGLALFSWVFTAYLLAAATTVPLYGRLADIHGRRPVLLVGAGLFLLGSALCGLAQSMDQLIAFRALQGLGAGAVQPICQTILGDLYTLEERARVQGYFSGVFNLAAVIGPLVGGVLVDTVGWRWVFYVNLPIGLAAMMLIAIYLRDRRVDRPGSLDLLGSAALGVGVASLLGGLLARGGTAVGLEICAAACLALLIRQERHAADPILPVELFRERIIVVASVGGFILSIIVIGLSTYIPLYAQGVLGEGATAAGALLIPISAIWTLGSIAGGRIILRLGYRGTTLIGCSVTAVAGLALFTVGTRTPTDLLIAILTLAGTGFGLTVTPYIIAVQTSVPWNRRGTATALYRFMRALGQGIGVTLLGVVLNARLFAALPPGLTADDLLDVTRRASLAPAELLTGRAALMGALHAVYGCIGLCGLLVLLTAFAMPGGRAASHAVAEASGRS